HSEDGSVQEDVLPAGQIRVKAGSYLQQARNSPSAVYSSGCRLRNAAQDLQQRALPCTVRADDAYNLPLIDFERNVPQRPELLAFFSRSPPGGGQPLKWIA